MPLAPRSVDEDGVTRHEDVEGDERHGHEANELVARLLSIETHLERLKRARLAILRDREDLTIEHELAIEARERARHVRERIRHLLEAAREECDPPIVYVDLGPNTVDASDGKPSTRPILLTRKRRYVHATRISTDRPPAGSSARSASRWRPRRLRPPTAAASAAACVLSRCCPCLYPSPARDRFYTTWHYGVT